MLNYTFIKKVQNLLIALIPAMQLILLAEMMNIIFFSTQSTVLSTLNLLKTKILFFYTKVNSHWISISYLRITRLIDLVRRLRKHQRFVEIPNEVSPHVLIDHGLFNNIYGIYQPKFRSINTSKKAIYFDYKCRYPGSIFREIDNFVAFQFF